MPLVVQITGDTQHADLARTAARAVLSSPVSDPRSAWVANIGLALLAVQESDLAGAEELYAALEPMATLMPAEGHICISMERVMGVLAFSLGRLDQAVAHFEQGLSLCRKAGYRPELAWTCLGVVGRSL